MGRPKLKLVITEPQRAELRDALKANTDARQRDRMQAIQLATTGRHTHAEIAQLLGKARSTIQVWLDHYQAGQLTRLLERKTAPGKVSELQAPKIQADLQAGLRAGRWRTAGQIAAWLKQTHGIQRAAGSIYYWLGKVGGTLKVPRPAHTKQNPAAQAEFRAHLLKKLQALPVPAGPPVKVWVADECRVGLHTLTRRCWGLRGQAGGRSQAAALPVGICLRSGGSGGGRHAIPVPALGQSGTERGVSGTDRRERPDGGARRDLGRGRIPPHQ